MNKISPPKPGPGRPRGSPNKLTATARENIVTTFNRVGGLDAFEAWARANQTEFYRLYAKLLPMDVRIDASMNYTAVPIPVEERYPIPAECNPLRKETKTH
jgi:hypothetical protein